MTTKRSASRRSPFAGNKGQGSKWIRKTTRLKIYERDGWKCVWCQRKVCQGSARYSDPEMRKTGCLDHILPRASGGGNAPSNLLTSCLDCNEERGERSAPEYATAKAEQVRRDEWLARNYYFARTISTIRADILERVLVAMSTPIARTQRRKVAA